LFKCILHIGVLSCHNTHYKCFAFEARTLVVQSFAATAIASTVGGSIGCVHSTIASRIKTLSLFVDAAPSELARCSFLLCARLVRTDVLTRRLAAPCMSQRSRDSQPYQTRGACSTAARSSSLVVSEREARALACASRNATSGSAARPGALLPQEL
jgi:hypothetical protein